VHHWQRRQTAHPPPRVYQPLCHLGQHGRRHTCRARTNTAQSISMTHSIAHRTVS
jgi:hypothetical protein